ncbi:unnamed protein product [Durusdinium trenchii]|uniref:Uncharacterized protein n=1 Tax=Durusdinium trenchii TaxID=1381693 RepID=A0ABP0JTU8_9DINO
MARRLLFLLKLAAAGDCSFSFSRPQSTDRAIPSTDEAGLHLAWQEKDALYVQDISRDGCHQSAPSLLNRSASLAFPGNGLAASLATTKGLAVAWKDQGSIFLKLGDLGPVQLNSTWSVAPSVALAETDCGVAISWSTWQDGWVTEIRRCCVSCGQLDCSSKLDLHRNITMPSHWLPQMLWCDGLWALFNDGPYLNFLGHDSLSSGPTVDFHDEVITAAMDCTGKEVVTLWVEKNGTVQWRYTPSPSGTPPSLLKGRRLERRESLGVEPGEVSVFVSQGFLLVVNNAVKLQVQLLNYMHSARYPVHDLAIGAQDVEIAMDCAGECHGVFICWSSAGDFGQDGSFHCTYKGLVALIDVDGLGAGGQMIIVIVFSLLFLLCLLKQCSGGAKRQFQSVMKSTCACADLKATSSYGAV